MRIVLAMGMFSLAQPVIGEPGIPFRLSSSAVEPVPMQLDAADRQWLASQGTLRVGIATVDYEPVDITTDRNNYQGLSADYLSILRDKLDAARRRPQTPSAEGGLRYLLPAPSVDAR